MFNQGNVAKFHMKENVEYKIINRNKFVELLSQAGVEISQEIVDLQNLEAIEIEAKKHLSDDVVSDLKERSVRQIFQENALGRAITKRGLGHGVLPLIPHLFGHWANAKHIENLVTNAGLAGVASRINGSGGEAAFTYIAIGTGTTAAAAGDTALQTEISTSGGARAAATASRVTTTQTNDTAQLQLTFNFTGSFAVTESGVLNAASTGTLLAHQVFTAVNVVSGDSLQVTWKFAVS